MATHWPDAGLALAHTALQLSATPLAQQLHRLAPFTDAVAKYSPNAASPKSALIAQSPHSSLAGL
jgi:hypothetical protein